MRKLSRCKKDSILREANYICMYCGDPSNEVDHIHPHSYSLNDKEENLASSCPICNRIAGSEVFDGFIEKQSYILDERKKKRWANDIKEYRSLCSAVGLPLYIEKRIVKKPKKKEKPKRRGNLDGSSVRPKPKLLPTVKPNKKVRRRRKKRPTRAITPVLDYSIEVLKEMLNILHKDGLSWEQMGAKLGVPGGTLWDVAHGKPVPRKWRRRVSRDLFAMPVAELLWALDNREEM